MPDTLNKALLAAQKAMPALQKNAINPHFKSRYISLDSLMEQILPVLNEHGLVLTQLPTQVGGQPALCTRITHAESGESIEDTMLLIIDKQNPQGQGSGITYGRRYAIMSFLGLVADVDDDANAASTQQVTQQRPTQADSDRATVEDSAAGIFEHSDSPF